mmetsp:Transcript_35350/g.82616  ORF Transcript_35350/g.82616 Transcript_35350/m.82616 type:complete len:724 (+) Transcript_35350:90-2261(+)
MATTSSSSAPVRVAVLAQDDTVAPCLSAFIGSQVIGLDAGGKPCPAFAKRCAELGFDHVGTQDSAMASLLLKHYAPEVLVLLPDLGPCALFDNATAQTKLKVRCGQVCSGSPWPEFMPIFQGLQDSSVELVRVSSNGQEGTVASRSVTIADGETAISLRLKHIEQAKELLASLPPLSEGTTSEALSRSESTSCSSGGGAPPSKLSLEWDEEKVDRFLRAHFLPPNDPAKVEDPSTGEVYFIENLAQFREFETLWSAGLPQEAAKSGAYAADTHWYKITNEGLRKVGEQSVHKPRHVKDGPFPRLIPGAAVKGGPKKLRMNEPFIGPLAEQYCGNVLSSTWIGVEGPYVKRFEALLARICGCAAACAVQSGTAACYGAMKALGVCAPSNHVLVPAFTCSACGDAVVHAGGTPIPVDCELDSYGVSAQAVLEALERDPQVVGIVVAPCYGVPLRDYNEIQAICKDRGLWLCEDACESYGASQTTPEGIQVPLGSKSTITVVSVRSEKMIGVGEGGAILSNDVPLVTKARWWCSRAPARGGTLWRVYEHEAIGQNFRLPEMLAAIGCAAGEMFPVTVERKRAIHAWYEAKFASTPELSGLKLQVTSKGDDPVWWINTAVLPEGYSAEEMGMKLMKQYPDIEIRPGFFPLDTMEIFKSKMVVPCKNAELLYKRLIALPSSVHLQEQDVERVVKALAVVITELKEGAAKRAAEGSAVEERPSKAIRAA